MTDYEKALKDAHEHADKALDKVEDAAKSARDRFKSWLKRTPLLYVLSLMHSGPKRIITYTHICYK